MRYVLVGNFGVGNVGDEAIKQYYLEFFPDIEWIVLSAQPIGGELHRLPFGLRSLLTPWWKTVAALRRSDGMVFGGGSLFTDTESMWACLIWGWHAWIAHIMGKNIFFAFQGVGPFRSKFCERLTGFVFKKARYISVRDARSFTRVTSWNMNTKVIQTFDPVFSLAQSKKKDVSSQNVLTIIPRKNSGIPFQKAVREHMQHNTYDRIAILLLEPDSKTEQAYASIIVRDVPGATIISVRTTTELFDRLAESRFIISERYHGIIPALGLGIPLEVVIQKEGDKLSTLRDMTQQGIDTPALSGNVEAGRATLHAALAS